MPARHVKRAISTAEEVRPPRRVQAMVVGFAVAGIICIGIGVLIGKFVLGAQGDDQNKGGITQQQLDAAKSDAFERGKRLGRDAGFADGRKEGYKEGRESMTNTDTPKNVTDAYNRGYDEGVEKGKELGKAEAAAATPGSGDYEKGKQDGLAEGAKVQGLTEPALFDFGEYIYIANFGKIKWDSVMMSITSNRKTYTITDARSLEPGTMRSYRYDQFTDSGRNPMPPIDKQDSMYAVQVTYKNDRGENVRKPFNNLKLAFLASEE
jgi:hypothetical protein